MKRLIRKSICLMLSLLMVISLAGCGEKTWVLSENLPAYYHYDSEDFIENCEKLEKYLEDGKVEDFLELYDEMQVELLKVSDLMAVAEILVDTDLTDTEISEEMLYIQGVYDEMKNRFNTCCSDMCASQYAEQFRTHLDNDVVFEAYSRYVTKSEELLGLNEQEQALIAEYKKAYNELDQYTCSAKGRTYCYSDIDSLDFDNEEDKEIYVEINKAINAGLGEIYVKLVKVRQEKAKLLGYDNYGEYIDEVVYNRSFGTEDLDCIRQTLMELGENIDYLRSFALCNADAELTVSEEKFQSNLSKVFKEVSLTANDVYEMVIDEDLYNMGAGENRADSAYMYGIPSVGKGYLFYSMSGNTRDYELISHEIGHLTNAILAPSIYYTIIDDNIDLMECQSTGLQILFAMKARNILPEYTDAIYAYDIVRLLDYAYDGFEGDSFERKVYADPDITLEKINQYSLETKQEYGEYDYLLMGYDWVYIPHFFNTPFYYLSYGIAGFTSLQLYEMAVEDYGEAVAIWEKLVAIDCSMTSYSDAVAELGYGSYKDEDICWDAVAGATSDAWDIADGLGLIEYEDDSDQEASCEVKFG